MKRRDFLRIGAGSMASTVAGSIGLVTWTPRAHALTIAKTFYILQGNIAQPDGVSVHFKGFSDTTSSLRVPATSFIVQEGDTVSITVSNTLSTPHSWVINGVFDSGTISGGQTKTFSFPAPKAGSYFFYDKLNAPYNRLVGLHGAMAVMPAGSANTLYSGSPTFRKQLFWIFNDIDPVWHDRIRQGLTPTTTFVPRYFTLNGKSSRPPGATGYTDPNINSMYDPATAIEGYIGDRTLIRIFNAGQCTHSMHWHANHVEWLTENGSKRPSIWLKDVVRLDNNMGRTDVIFPFDPPPDAYPPVTMGHYVMHLHDEQTQTAGGGLYQFGAQAGIKFK